MPLTQPRRHKRKALDHLCVLDLQNGGKPIPCQMADISDGGARLIVFQDTAPFPASITLILSSTGNGPRRWCDVVWRAQREIGVKFARKPV